ncbi:MAG TPA: hypothetical protein PK515_04460 [Candidatus Cloacimonas sp.]|nr:hypothetical protein [Candidatus Cloacimonas sp.]
MGIILSVTICAGLKPVANICRPDGTNLFVLHCAGLKPVVSMYRS